MLPIINVQAPGLSASENRVQLAREIGVACREIGFFYLRNHGLEASIEPLFDLSKAYFAQAETVKSRQAISKQSGNRGYVGLEAEALDPAAAVDFKECFNVRIDPAIADDENGGYWPPFEGFRPIVASYFNAAYALGVQVHRAIAMDLGADAHFFDPLLLNPMATLRLLHYPPSRTGDAPPLGAGEHTDYGNLTFLLTDDAGGLQARRRDGAWIDVPHVPGAFVCNIGDCLMRWSNDLYVSTPHRVVAPLGRERYSIAFFLDPNAEAIVAPLPTCVGPERPALYQPISAGDYFRGRFAATYGFT